MATLILKLDTKKVFDPLIWDYLMDMLQHMGFPRKFHDWILAILSTSTSRVLLKGIVVDLVKHGRGLWQGDPLSSLLFILAIDPLHHILRKATDQGHLHIFHGRSSTVCTSLFSNDVAIFVKPNKNYVDSLASILSSFGNVIGLVKL
jgi:hypothetical protein